MQLSCKNETRISTAALKLTGTNWKRPTRESFGCHPYNCYYPLVLIFFLIFFFLLSFSFFCVFRSLLRYIWYIWLSFVEPPKYLSWYSFNRHDWTPSTVYTVYTYIYPGNEIKGNEQPSLSVSVACWQAHALGMLGSIILTIPRVYAYIKKLFHLPFHVIIPSVPSAPTTIIAPAISPAIRPIPTSPTHELA